MYADHRGGWTRIFGGKATSRLVEKCNFYLPYMHLAPPLGVIPSGFRRDLLRHKTADFWLSRGVVRVILRLVVFVEHRLVIDRRTDGQAMTANTALV